MNEHASLKPRALAARGGINVAAAAAASPQIEKRNLKINFKKKNNLNFVGSREEKISPYPPTNHSVASSCTLNQTGERFFLSKNTHPSNSPRKQQQKRMRISRCRREIYRMEEEEEAGDRRRAPSPRNLIWEFGDHKGRRGESPLRRV